jgi:hypothetical protein
MKQNSGRGKKAAIVALARKLLVTSWTMLRRSRLGWC